MTTNCLAHPAAKDLAPRLRKWSPQIKAELKWRPLCLARDEAAAPKQRWHVVKIRADLPIGAQLMEPDSAREQVAQGRYPVTLEG